MPLPGCPAAWSPTRQTRQHGGDDDAIYNRLVVGNDVLLIQAAEREKRAAELDTIFKTTMRDGTKMIGAERCSLFLVDAAQREVWSKVATGRDGEGGIIRVPLGQVVVN